MRKFTLFESAIMGLFVGVIVATYLAFLYGTEGYVGNLLNYIALIPIFHLLRLSSDQVMIYSFFFVTIVFVIYGIIIGSLMKIGDKSTYGVLVLILAIISGMIWDQKIGSTALANMPNTNVSQAAAVGQAIRKIPTQYFGTETAGDLNGDSKDDIAFIVSRNDAERGDLYYLLGALSVDQGHAGTNILFLGDKVKPENLKIENGIVAITYTKHSSKSSTTTDVLFAALESGSLKLISSSSPFIASSSTAVASTTISTTDTSTTTITN